MAKIRVLVVDDSVVIRRQVSDELSQDPAIEVSATASNGRQALTKLEQVTVDVVILDIEMPEMDGLTALGEIRKKYPKLPVIMFSSLTERGAIATLDALAAGASSYFPKPNTGGLDESRRIIREHLVPEVKALGIRTRPTPVPPTRVGVARRVEVLLLGASTGGPNALATVLGMLGGPLPVPILITQHMPPTFTRLLADRLTRETRIPITEAVNGQALEAGHGYVAPGDFHLTVVRVGTASKTQIDRGPPENSCRPAVDPLFRTAAQVYLGGCLGVVLTGMGQDGLRGSEFITAAGGQVLAQDEATSVVWGMPGAVARSGLASMILPLGEIGPEIVRRVRGSVP